ncbi:GAF domain-containing protein [Mastigocladus laminosus UU774]|nr:sensor histidine kinase [Westiellopsis prolifica IICB1]TFI56146.1 GAF domain-containing protein [Mastigocladus laminosus UU774]
MLMSASSEFIDLCREQMALLVQGLGASLSVVYLTQELVEAPTSEAKLIPLVVYPETAVGVQHANALALPKLNHKLLTAAKDFPTPLNAETEDRTSKNPHEEYLLSGDKIVLPLVYKDVVMGLLVTAREDRTWNEQERDRIESIARTLAIACILDQRRTWLEMQLHQQQILQEKQQDLLDNLLHQFRNPLTALRTFGKLLLKRLRPGDPNREVAESIVRESDRLQELLKKFDEVIDFGVENLAPLKLPEQQEIFVEATVEKEHKPALLLPGTGEKEADCYIAEILQPLLVSAQAIAQERNLQLTTNIPSHLPLVHANRKALTEVFSNIIDNALKYTPAGGKILIEAGQQKDNLQGVAITDTGPGIPVQDLEHLGERRYRGVQAQTTIPGTGLGIAIAKQLIEQMQGEIEVKSPALNSAITSPQTPGTTFIVWLPIADR